MPFCATQFCLFDPFCAKCKLFTFIWKFYEGQKKMNFGCSVFIFALLIRNKSLCSGKNNNLLQIWKDVVKCTYWQYGRNKKQKQMIYDGRIVQVWEIVFQGLNIRKWNTGKHCDGVAVKKT